MDLISNLLGSKKFIAAVIGLVVALAAEVGLELDTEAIMTIVSPIIAYILGQGVADIGKEKAIVDAALKPEPPTKNRVGIETVQLNK